MGKLYAKDNFQNQNWELDTTELGPYSNDLYIGFTNDAPILDFHNLRFGFTLSLEGSVEQEIEYPTGNKSFERSDQEYLVSTRIPILIPGKLYTLSLWAENDSVNISDSFDIDVPYPDKPYDSWIWDEQSLKWSAPKQKPKDSNKYTWDEETTSWVVAETDETQS